MKMQRFLMFWSFGCDLGNNAYNLVLGKISLVKRQAKKSAHDFFEVWKLARSVAMKGMKSCHFANGLSGQIIATSHDLGPQKVAVWKGNPLISGKSRLVKHYTSARYLTYFPIFLKQIREI